MTLSDGVEEEKGCTSCCTIIHHCRPETDTINYQSELETRLTLSDNSTIYNNFSPYWWRRPLARPLRVSARSSSRAAPYSVHKKQKWNEFFLLLSIRDRLGPFAIPIIGQDSRVDSSSHRKERRICLFYSPVGSHVSLYISLLGFGDATNSPSYYLLPDRIRLTTTFHPSVVRVLPLLTISSAGSRRNSSFIKQRLAISSIIGSTRNYNI